MEKNKQTAVEWLVNEFNQKIDYIPVNKWDMIRDIIKQALALEKEQIENASSTSYSAGQEYHMLNNDKLPKQFAEQYYKRIYGK